MSSIDNQRSSWRSTREAYRDTLVGLLPLDPRMICLDTDTGLFTSTDFGACVERYINLGIAEHNLMGVAAGLAASGWMPYVNTMAAFAASRATEFVKIDIAYNNLPVRIMATHGGLSAGHLGPTHQALDDLAIMRVLPNMTVVVPADADAVEQVVTATVSWPGPVYIRLGRKPTPQLPTRLPPLRIGVAQQLRAGSDVLLVACGPHPVAAALHATTTLAAEGISAALLNVHTVKPLDTHALCAAAAPCSLVVTVEEHWRTGGLGGAVAEVLSTLCPTRLVRLGVPDRFSADVGDHQSLLRRNGISAEAVVGTVRRLLDSSPRQTPELACACPGNTCGRSLHGQL